MPSRWSVVGVTVVGGRWAVVLYYAGSQSVILKMFLCNK